MTEFAWSDDVLVRVAEMRMARKSLAEIGIELGLTPQAVKSGIHRYRDRLPTRKDVPVVSGHLRGNGEELNSPWRYVQISPSKLFIYYGHQSTPTYKFERSGGSTTHWKGHGVYGMSRALIFGWVNRQLPPKRKT